MSRTQSFLSNDALSEPPASPAAAQASSFLSVAGGEAAAARPCAGRVGGIAAVPRSRIAGLPMFTQEVQAGRALPNAGVLDTMPSEAGSEVRQAFLGPVLA